MKREWTWAGGGEDICVKVLRKQFLHPMGSDCREAKGMMGRGGRRGFGELCLPPGPVMRPRAHCPMSGVDGAGPHRDERLGNILGSQEGSLVWW